MLTLSVFERYVQTAYRLGANCFLSKPVVMAEFTGQVRHMCAFWLGPCRLPVPDPVRRQLAMGAMGRRTKKDLVIFSQLP